MADTYERILIGYRPDEHGGEAMALGVDLARATGATLVLASVVPAVFIEHPGKRSGEAVVHSGARDKAEAALEAAAAELGEAHLLTPVQRRLEASPSPAFGLHDLAEEQGADLIVLGSTHHSAVGKITVGTVAERLLHGAPCAVAVAPAGYDKGADRDIAVVGVAFDGSPESHLALRSAHALAARAGATLRVLTAIEPLPPVLERWVPLPGLDQQVQFERTAALEHQGQAAQAMVLDALTEFGGDTKIESTILDAKHPAPVLLEAAERDEVDLLVVGSRGYGPWRRALLGSVSGALVRAATMPVLVVPRAAGADG